MLEPHAAWLLDNTRGARASLAGATFNDVNLVGVTPRLAMLRGATFLDLDLSGADLSGSNLEGADFGKSTMNGPTLPEPI